jgi:hypothetical protein
MSPEPRFPERKNFFHGQGYLFSCLLFLELFQVTVMNTKDSERLQIVGDYYLSVEPKFLCLLDIKTDAITTQWNLQYLPRFNLRKVSKLQDLDMILVIWASR